MTFPTTAQLFQDEAEHRKRLARHELGHYVAARELGFQTGQIKIWVKADYSVRPPEYKVDGGATIYLIQGIADLKEMECYLARRIIVLLAGSCAESLKDDLVVDREQSHKCPGAKSDLDKASELINTLRNIRHATTQPDDLQTADRELRELHEKLWEKATQHVEQNATRILSLAKYFETNVTRDSDFLERLEDVKSMPKLLSFDELLS